MSNQIVGNTKTLQGLKINGAIGNQPILVKVSVNIPSLSNRKTEAKTIRKYLKNGYIPALWSPPLVAELPNGDQYLYDGDHRRHIWKLANPNNSTMDAYVVKVSNKAEISQLFVQINKTHRKNLASEETFVHEVLAGEQAAVQTDSNLKDCYLSVSLGTGEANSTVGSAKGLFNKHAVSIKIEGFKRIVKELGIEPTKKASQLIQTTWKTDNSLSVESLYGVARLFKEIPAISSNKNYIAIKKWEEYFKTQGNLHKSGKAFTSFCKTKGGEKVNKDEICVALGLVRHFKETCGLSKTSFNTLGINELEVKLQKELEKAN